jgi:hypothetical protein
LNEAYIQHMAERQPRQTIQGDFDNRSDYHFSDGAEREYLKVGHSGMWYSAHGGVATRHLSTVHSNDEEEPVWFVGDNTLYSRVLQYVPLTVSLTLETNTFYGVQNNDHLQEVAELTAHETIEGRNTYFMTRYVFERYRNDLVHATIAVRDHIEKDQPNERDMTPYDFEEFNRQLAVMAALRKGVAVGREKEQHE